MLAIHRCSVAPVPPARRLDSRGIPGIQRAGVVRNTPNLKRLKALPCGQRTSRKLNSQQNDMDGTSVRHPVVAENANKYRLESDAHNRGFIIQISFKSRADYTTWDKFLNGYLKY